MFGRLKELITFDYSNLSKTNLKTLRDSCISLKRMSTSSKWKDGCTTTLINMLKTVSMNGRLTTNQTKAGLFFLKQINDSFKENDSVMVFLKFYNILKNMNFKNETSNESNSNCKILKRTVICYSKNLVRENEHGVLIKGIFEKGDIEYAMFLLEGFKVDSKYIEPLIEKALGFDNSNPKKYDLLLQMIKCLKSFDNKILLTIKKQLINARKKNIINIKLYNFILIKLQNKLDSNEVNFIFNELINLKNMNDLIMDKDKLMLLISTLEFTDNKKKLNSKLADMLIKLIEVIWNKSIYEIDMNSDVRNHYSVCFKESNIKKNVVFNLTEDCRLYYVEILKFLFHCLKGLGLINLKNIKMFKNNALKIKLWGWFLEDYKNFKKGNITYDYFFKILENCNERLPSDVIKGNIYTVTTDIFYIKTFIKKSIDNHISISNFINDIFTNLESSRLNYANTNSKCGIGVLFYIIKTWYFILKILFKQTGKFKIEEIRSSVSYTPILRISCDAIIDVCGYKFSDSNLFILKTLSKIIYFIVKKGTWFKNVRIGHWVEPIFKVISSKYVNSKNCYLLHNLFESLCYLIAGNKYLKYDIKGDQRNMKLIFMVCKSEVMVLAERILNIIKQDESKLKIDYLIQILTQLSICSGVNFSKELVKIIEKRNDLKINGISVLSKTLIWHELSMMMGYEYEPLLKRVNVTRFDTTLISSTHIESYKMNQMKLQREILFNKFVKIFKIICDLYYYRVSEIGNYKKGVHSPSFMNYLFNNYVTNKEYFINNIDLSRYKKNKGKWEDKITKDTLLTFRRFLYSASQPQTLGKKMTVMSEYITNYKNDCHQKYKEYSRLHQSETVKMNMKFLKYRIQLSDKFHNDMLKRMKLLHKNLIETQIINNTKVHVKRDNLFQKYLDSLITIPKNIDNLPLLKFDEALKKSIEKNGIVNTLLMIQKKSKMDNIEGYMCKLIVNEFNMLNIQIKKDMLKDINTIVKSDFKNIDFTFVTSADNDFSNVGIGKDDKKIIQRELLNLNSDHLKEVSIRNQYRIFILLRTIISKMWNFSFKQKDIDGLMYCLITLCMGISCKKLMKLFIPKIKLLYQNLNAFSQQEQSTLRNVIFKFTLFYFSFYYTKNVNNNQFTLASFVEEFKWIFHTFTTNDLNGECRKLILNMASYCDNEYIFKMFNITNKKNTLNYTLNSTSEITLLNELFIYPVRKSILYKKNI